MSAKPLDTHADAPESEAVTEKAQMAPEDQTSPSEADALDAIVAGQSSDPVPPALAEPAADAVPDTPPDPPAPLSPGQQLRAARLARKLSLDDVADTLRFSPRQITLIEEDRYSELPGATLVRGFIRGYAKLLKLDPEPLLAALTPEVPPTVADVRPPQTICDADDPNADSSMGKQLSWKTIGAALVLILAVGLVAFFFIGNELGDEVKASWKTPEPTQTSVAPPAVVSLDAAQDNAIPNDPTQPPPPALVAEFDDRSWIEVRDAKQKVVFVGEYPKGTRQAIFGKAPFQVWIGRASAVRLTYGERSIDLKPHSREDVARLVVE